MSRPLVGYVRVSTDKQHASGLGEDAQRKALTDYAARNGATFVRVFEEVETSTKRSLDNRPALAEAIQLTRLTKGVLVIAKLDRLSRNVAFLSSLMDSGTEFVACDMPSANRLTLHIMAAVAEDESRRISQRTKDALAAYKAQGGKLGGARPECRNLTEEGQRLGSRLGARSRREKAIQDTIGVLTIARPLRQQGTTLAEIASRLNSAGYPTRGGSQWTPTAVKRVLDRDETVN